MGVASVKNSKNHNGRLSWSRAMHFAAFALSGFICSGSLSNAYAEGLAPTIGAVTDAASYRTGVALGSIGIVWGEHLSSDTCKSSVPKAGLCGTDVSIRVPYTDLEGATFPEFESIDIPVRLSAASPLRLDFLLPTNKEVHDKIVKKLGKEPLQVLQGQVLVSTEAGVARSPYEVGVGKEYQNLSFFTDDSSGKGLAILQRIDLKTGEYISVKGNSGKGALPESWYAAYATGRNESLHNNGLIASPYWLVLSKDFHDSGKRKDFVLGKPAEFGAPSADRISGPLSVGYVGPVGSNIAGLDQINFFLPKEEFFTETMGLEAGKVHTLGLKICWLYNNWRSTFCSQEEVEIPVEVGTLATQRITVQRTNRLVKSEKSKKPRATPKTKLPRFVKRQLGR